MKWSMVLVVLMAAPVMGEMVTYTFDVTGGDLFVDIQGVGGSASSGLTGSFDMTIDQSDGHVGESDTFELGLANVSNTDLMSIDIYGLATATVQPGNVTLLEFAQDAPAHITAGGAALAQADAFVRAAVTVLYPSPVTTSAWAGELLPIDVIMETSAATSDIVTAELSIVYPFVIGIGDIGQTVTIDLIMDIEGTAHVVPDPAFGGLIALGLAGGGAWLRRRRS